MFDVNPSVSSLRSSLDRFFTADLLWRKMLCCVEVGRADAGEATTEGAVDCGGGAVDCGGKEDDAVDICTGPLALITCAAAASGSCDIRGGEEAGGDDVIDVNALSSSSVTMARDPFLTAYTATEGEIMRDRKLKRVREERRRVYILKI